MDLIFVGIGGALGSLVRYMLGKIIARKSKSAYPISTFTINVSGAILLGLLTGLNADENLYLLMGDGFSGAYTTFSTFMYEGFNSFMGNKKLNALVYILATLLLGIIGYAAGFGTSKFLFNV